MKELQVNFYRDPSLYRRKETQRQQGKFGSKVTADSIGNETFCGNISPQEQYSKVNDTYKASSSTSVQSDPTTLQQTHKAAIDTYKLPSDPSEKLQERMSKLAEMKTLLSWYGSPEDINIILAAGLTLDLNSEINDHFIDEELAWIHKKVKFDESLSQLLSPVFSACRLKSLVSNEINLL